MTVLRLSKDLTLPGTAITDTFAILAVRGAGKSNTAAVMAEEMFKAGLPFVVVDPIGAWWGLRSSRDGKGPGLPILIFGGKHGDVPLERGGGQLIADLIVDQRISCVLDISEFESEAAKKQFLLDFARRLYQRNEEPLHLFLEEADDYIPQKPMRDELQLLRAWENIGRRGRGRGIGFTPITQRSAVLNKNVLTQCQTLIAMRTTGPQDIAAIEAWLKYHQQSKEILESLPSLDDGEAWVWSPRFLKKTVRVRFRLRETFDSGATPKMTKAARKPATLADVDLKSVKEKMAATIERAKAEDPRALRVRIQELERQVKAAPAPTSAPKVEPKTVEVPILKEKDLKRFEKSIDSLNSVAMRMTTMFDTAGVVLQNVQSAASTIGQQLQRRANIPDLPAARPIISSPVPLKTHKTSSQGSGQALPGGERKILTALAQYPGGRTKVQVAILTGYAHSGGGFQNYLSSLRGKGFIVDQGDLVVITPDGLIALGPFTPLPTGTELLDHWRRQLSKAERAALDVLVADYPESIPQDEVAQRAGYTPGTGGINNAISRLRTLELIQGYGTLKASDTLFD